MSGFVFDTYTTAQAGGTFIPFAGTWGPASNRTLAPNSTIGGGDWTYTGNTQVTYDYSTFQDFTQLATIRLQDVSNVLDIFSLSIFDSDFNFAGLLGTVDGNDIVWIVNSFLELI